MVFYGTDGCPTQIFSVFTKFILDIPLYFRLFYRIFFRSISVFEYFTPLRLLAESFDTAALFHVLLT
uniref:Uncharacterized protein n=1 Tax=Tetraselmis sp. GSL018 TaxID=582737 RepID=A0A061S6H4_9CHLO